MQLSATVVESTNAKTPMLGTVVESTNFPPLFTPKPANHGPRPVFFVLLATDQRDRVAA
jgi:hypothetical protein